MTTVRYGDGRASFIAHLGAIEKWMHAGHTLKSYYDAHKFPIKYEMLSRHYRNYVAKTRPKAQSASQKPNLPLDKNATTLKPNQTPATVPFAIKQFIHNPVPDIDALV